MDFSFYAQPIPIVLPESPRQSPDSPVEPIDLRDIGDLPVKLELRYAIESRRSEKGLDMPVVFNGSRREKPLLTMEEEERRKVRRQRNKIAASKCRIKRKNHVRTLLKESEELTNSNNRLEEEIAQLREEKNKLVDALKGHLCIRQHQVPERRIRNSA